MSPNKKPRIGEAVVMEKSSSFLGNAILQQTKDDFMAGLVDFDSTSETTTTTESQDPLNKLDNKVQEMSSWIMEYKLRVKRDERVRRKARKEEQLRAIYQENLPQRAGSRPTGFTAELVTVLLDSGFLKSAEIGKLCLLTGKWFFSELQLDHGFLWQKIWDAKFQHQAECGLTTLLQSQKFSQMLELKGYEWMFRHVFTQSLCDEEGNTVGGITGTTEVGRDLIIRDNHEPLPASALNKNNVFLVALMESSDDHGFLQPFHAIVLDSEENLDALLSEENSTYEAPLSSEEAQRIKSGLDQSGLDEFSAAADKKRVDWKKELRNRFEAHPGLFHSGLSEALQLDKAMGFNISRDFLLEFMFRFQISILVFRMDSHECKLVSQGPDGIFEYDYSRASLRVGHGKEVPLNGFGKDMAKNALLQEHGEVDGHAHMNIPCGVDFECEGDSPNDEFFAYFRAYDSNGVDPSTTESGMDMYRILDYGMNWS